MKIQEKPERPQENNYHDRKSTARNNNTKRKQENEHEIYKHMRMLQ